MPAPAPHFSAATSELTLVEASPGTDSSTYARAGLIAGGVVGGMFLGYASWWGLCRYSDRQHSSSTCALAAASGVALGAVMGGVIGGTIGSFFKREQ